MIRNPFRHSLLSLTVLTLAACGDGPSGPPVPVEVLVTPSRDTLTVTGGTVRFSAQVLGKKGKVLTGIPITWTSSRPTVAEIDETGLAAAVSPGVAQIRATASGVVGQASLTVALEPVHAEKMAGDGQTGIVGRVLGELLQLQVTDGAGFPIPGVSVTFTVLQGGGFVFPAFPRTEADGTVSVQWTMGWDPEEPQRVEVSVGELSTEFHAAAVWPPPEVLTTSLLTGRLTLEYAGKLEAMGGTGASYTWSLSGGSLPSGITLSPQGELAGTPTEEGSFSFTAQVEDSEEEVASRELTFRVCPAPAPLNPGEARVLEPTGEDGCGFFLPTGDAGDRYRVGIVRSETNRDPDDVLTVTLEVRGLGVQPAPVPELGPIRIPSLFQFPQPLQEAEEIARSTEAFHLRLREEEQRLLVTFPPDFRPLPSFSSQASAVVAARAQGAPEKRLLRFATDGCTDVMPKTAILLGENEHVAVYQDSLQRTTEPVSLAAVQTMLDYYQAYGKRVIDGYFGGVSDVNGDGQVVVYVAPGISDGVAGFVRSSDMLGQELCASSNQMEITYLKASFVNGYETGNYQLVGTLVHEIKHISSLYKRLVDRKFHPSWVEEGTAEIATDRASRLAMSETGGPAMGDMLTLDDIADFGRTVEGYNTLLRLSRSLRYIASQPNSVTVDPRGAEFMSQSGPKQRHTIYGAGWHFHRWLGDAYGGAATPFADTALFRVQNDSLTIPGPEAYPDLVGRTFSELMEEYAAAVMLNGTEAPAPQRAFTSVDFPSAMSSTSVYSAANRPPGLYPWPVTMTGAGAGSVSLETATYSGRMGESGLRVHDFTSNGTGQGAEVTVFAPAMARVVVVRLK
jgi:hypothetical protein